VRPLHLARLPAYNEYHTNYFCWFPLCDRVDSMQRPGVVSEVRLVVEAVKVFLYCLAEGFPYVEVGIWGF